MVILIDEYDTPLQAAHINGFYQPVCDWEYADCFGFTQAEVEVMANYYGVPDKIGEIKEWYDGYRFGELDIYNPWSVLRYFKSGCVPRAYWLDTSSNDLVIEVLHRLTDTQQDQIEKLSDGGYAPLLVAVECLLVVPGRGRVPASCSWSR